jgi:hypothetical protein
MTERSPPIRYIRRVGDQPLGELSSLAASRSTVFPSHCRQLPFS